MKNASDLLVDLGLKQYEAKVYAALVSLGPTGVSEISRFSGVPRNKVYEIMDALTERSVVEVQPGRPTIFRAVPPRMAVDRLVEDYGRAAKEAVKLLEEEEDGPKEKTKTEHVWLVNGRRGIVTRLGEMVVQARKNIFAIETYPPDFALSLGPALRSAVSRGVKVRAVSIVDPMTKIKGSDAPKDGLVDYRLFGTSSNPGAVETRYDKEALAAVFRQISRFGGSFIVDDLRVLDIIRDESHGTRLTGIFTEAPVVPALQRLSTERFLELYSKPVRP